MTAAILVVEDDPSIRMGLEDTLTAKGYEVEVVGRGGERRRARADRPLRPRRARRHAARHRRLRGLPADPREPRARARRAGDHAVGARRRARSRARPRARRRRLRDQAVLADGAARARGVGAAPRAGRRRRADRASRSATSRSIWSARSRPRGGERIELPSRAFAILKVFARRPGEVVSRDVLLDEAWGYDDYPNTRTVDNHLVKLRRALEDEPEQPRWLVTVHGAGYKLDVPARSAVPARRGRSPR